LCAKCERIIESFLSTRYGQSASLASFGNRFSLEPWIVRRHALRTAKSTECVRINRTGLARCLLCLHRKSLLAKLVLRGIASLSVWEFAPEGPFFERRAFCSLRELEVLPAPSSTNSPARVSSVSELHSLRRRGRSQCIPARTGSPTLKIEGRMVDGTTRPPAAWLKARSSPSHVGYQSPAPILGTWQ
jgi:hypothetical protein